jgi:cell division protein FtsI (penicillin-binding protein 3)
MSFGYETQIPPIYTLTFFNAIANEGEMVRPIFVKEIRKSGKTEEVKKTSVVNKEICTPNTLNIIKQMLVDVVEKGTGSPVKSEYIKIAGKTGTAQISQGTSGYRNHQVTFCGYFPADNAKYSCIVVIRKPRNGYPSGGLMSGRVLKQIAEEINARFFHMDPYDYPRNPQDTIVPFVKNGRLQQTETALDALKVPYKNNVQSEWTSSGITSNNVILNNRKVIENLVPNVIGMGAKDAIYLLEKNGIKVSLSGKGKVVSQSIDPGTRISKGKTISIHLK